MKLVRMTEGASNVVVPPRLPDIHELREYVTVFDPSSPTSASAEAWVKSIEETGNCYGWTNELKLQCARVNLGGCAKLWLESCQQTVKTWLVFKSEIVKGFPTKKNPVYYHNLMSSRKWKHGEELEEYVYEMAAMGRKGGFTEDVTVTYIMSGLKVFLQKSGLAVSKTVTVQELLDQLRWVGNVEAVTPSTSRGVSLGSTGGMGIGGRNFKTVVEDVSCYQCHESGHVARKCPKVKCFRCLKEGHVRQDCKANLNPRSEVRREPRIASGANLMRVVDKKSLFRKSVQLAGKRFEAHVDSGADRSTIWEKFKHQVGKISACHLLLQGFGKGDKVKVTEMVRAKMQVDGVQLEMSLAVVPEWAQDSPVIIGKDFIERDDIVMVKRKGEVRFEWDEEEVHREEGSYSSEEDLEVAKMYKIDVSEGTHIDNGDINSEGSVMNTRKLTEVINVYRDCFALNLTEMGRANFAEMKIQLEDSEPVFVKPRRMEYAKESALAEITNELLEAGIIQETESPYNSRVVLVPKKNKQFRMAVDYRLLNAKTVKDRFPMPDVETCLNKLAGAQVFISVDLYSGYYQIPLDEQSQNYTAFSTNEGHYRFLRMPFGLANGCAVFQRAVNKMVEKARKRGVIVVAYMDDLVVAGQDEKEVLDKFVILLEVIREEGFTINLKKSHFFMREVQFLGFEVTGEGIKPGESKTLAVKEFPTPGSVHEVRQFLGLAGFFRRFVRNFSLIAGPLYQLLKKDAVFSWTEPQARAFDHIKNALTTRPLLALYDPSADLELHTDASSSGLAGILLMKCDAGWKPLGYFSRKTSATEAKYHSYDLEMLAIVASVERFRLYLLGRFFVIRTDCSAVRDAYRKREMDSRVARYFLKLQEYDFQLEHRSGSSMKHADALSRNAVEEPKEIESVVENIWTIEISNTDFLVSLQRQDPKLTKIVDVLSSDPRTDEDRQAHQNYVLNNHRLYRLVDGARCWVIPAKIRWRVVKSFHDDRGHFAEEKVLQMMKEQFWFPKMRKYVRSFIAACPKCAFYKGKIGKEEGFLHPIPKTPMPFHTVHLDHLGPFLRSSKGNEHLLVYICGFSKFVLLRAVKSTQTGPVLSMLDEVAGIFGQPARLITDRGTAFTSNAFSKYCSENGLEHCKIAVGTPRGNGQVERSNKTVLTALRSMVDDDDRKWDDKVKQIQWAINNVPNSTTKATPASLVLSFKPRDYTFNELIVTLHDEAEQIVMNQDEVRAKAISAIERNQREQKKYYDRNRRKANHYEVDDLVLVKKDQFVPGGSRKLEPRYKGPFIVTKVLCNDRYRIEDVPGAERAGRKFKTVYSADRMKRWCSLTDLENMDDDSDEDVEEY